MKENLEELNRRGMATAYPVFLGGAALTRAYVEQISARSLLARCVTPETPLKGCADGR